MPQVLSFPKMPFTPKHPCTLLLLTIFLLLGLFFLFHLPPSPLLPISQTTLFLSSASNSTIASYLRRLTLHPHLAGSRAALHTALFVHSHFHSLHLRTHITNYTALLSYPLHSSLTATLSNGSFFTLNLRDSNSTDVVLPYHAYSPSGRVYGKAVFLNYGRGEDYREVGVDVKGCVGIVRRGGGMGRNEVAEEAERNGVAAVLMYTEGNVGVERGTVMKGVGDPLSPGWAGAEKLDLDDPEVVQRFPKLPSMPISVEVALTILGSLGGSEVPVRWRESLKNCGVGWVGPGPTMLNFTYEVTRNWN